MAAPDEPRRRRIDVDSSTTQQEPADQAIPTIAPRAHGPILVEGPVELIAPDGSTEVHDRLFLCRCGHSGTKPLCDGSHKRNGFEAPGVPPTSRSGR